MAFQPVTNAILPALISQGFSNSADMQMQGASAMASGISSAGSSVAGGLEGLAKKNMEKSELDNITLGKAQSYANASDEQLKLLGIPREHVMGIMAEKDPYKRSGMLLQLDNLAEMAYKTNIVNTQMANAGQRQQAGFANTAATTAAKPTMTGVPIATKPAYFGGN